MHGILLFAHGARNPAWADPFHAIARHMQHCAPDQPVALAFLELMQPDLGSAAADLIARGCTELTVVPLFLGAGGHILNDLPQLVAQLQADHPQVTVRATATIGQTDAIIRAIAETALGLVAAAPPSP
jgi:sirohydrochlorin cobaltochelatase